MGNKGELHDQAYFIIHCKAHGMRRVACSCGSKEAMSYHARGCWYGNDAHTPVHSDILGPRLAVVVQTPGKPAGEVNSGASLIQSTFRFRIVTTSRWQYRTAPHMYMEMNFD
jgi:hypothetical protein